ncbi:hypothetical protein CF327_g5530 [Tilletia walkeri]|nr:hypothetical protein CF327_g5530 [Tilletia walkeri]
MMNTQPPFNAALGRFTRDSTSSNSSKDSEHHLPPSAITDITTPRVLGSPAIMDHPHFSSDAFSPSEPPSSVALPTPTQQHPQPSFERKTLTLLSGNRITSSTTSNASTSVTSPSTSSLATFSNPRATLSGSSSTITSAQSRGTGASAATHKTTASTLSTTRGLNIARPSEHDPQAGPYSHSLSFTPASVSPRYHHGSAGSLAINHADRGGLGYGVSSVSRSIPISSNAATRADTASDRYFITVLPPPDFPSDSVAAKRGTLVPLYPSLSGQLYAIARELSLPSIGGIALYLLDDGEGNPGPRVGDRSWNGLWKRHFEEEEAEQMALQAHRDAQADEARRMAARSDASWSSRIKKRPGAPTADLSITGTGPRSVEANSTEPNTSVSTSTSPTHRSNSAEEEEEHLADVPADATTMYADADEPGVSSGLSASGAEFDGAGTSSYDTIGSRASNPGLRRQRASISTRRNVNGAGGFKSESSSASAFSQDGRMAMAQGAARAPRQSLYRSGNATRPHHHHHAGSEQFSPGSNGLPIESSSRHSSLSFNQALQGGPADMPITGTPSPHSPRASLYHAQSQARLYHSMSGSIQGLVPPSMSMSAVGSGLRLPIVARFEWTVERSRPAAAWWDVWCERERARISQNVSGGAGVGSGRWSSAAHASQMYGQTPMSVSREAGLRNERERMQVGDGPAAYPDPVPGLAVDEPSTVPIGRGLQTGLVPASAAPLSVPFLENNANVAAPQTPGVVLPRRGTQPDLALGDGNDLTPHETSSNLGMLQHAPHSAPPANTAIGGLAVAAASLAAAAGAGEALNRAVHLPEGVDETRPEEPATPPRSQSRQEEQEEAAERDMPSSATATIVPSASRLSGTRSLQQQAFVFPPTPPSHVAVEQTPPADEVEVEDEDVHSRNVEQVAVQPLVESRDVDAAGAVDVQERSVLEDAQHPAELSGTTVMPSAQSAVEEPVHSESFAEGETRGDVDQRAPEKPVHPLELGPKDELPTAYAVRAVEEEPVHSNIAPDTHESQVVTVDPLEFQSMDPATYDTDNLVSSVHQEHGPGQEHDTVPEADHVQTQSHFATAEEDFRPQAHEANVERMVEDVSVEGMEDPVEHLNEPSSNFQQPPASVFGTFSPQYSLASDSQAQRVSISEPEFEAQMAQDVHASPFAYPIPALDTQPSSRNLSISSETRPQSSSSGSSDRELVLKQRQQAREAVRLQLQLEHEKAQSLSIQNGGASMQHGDIMAETVTTPVAEENKEDLHMQDGGKRASGEAVDRHVDNVEAAFREMQAQPEADQLSSMPLVAAAHDVLGPPPVSATAQDTFHQTLIPGGAVASVNASAAEDVEILAVQPVAPTHSFEVGDVVPFRDIEVHAEEPGVEVHSRSADAEQPIVSELAYVQNAPATVEIMPYDSQGQHAVSEHAPQQFEGHSGAEIVAGTADHTFESSHGADLTPRTEVKQHIAMSGWTIEPVQNGLPPPPRPPPRDVSTGGEEVDFPSGRFSGSSQRPRREPPPPGPPPRRALPQASARFVAPTVLSPQMVNSPLHGSEALPERASVPALPRTSIPRDISSEDFFAVSDQTPNDVLPAQFVDSSDSALNVAEDGEERLERKREETLAALEGGESPSLSGEEQTRGEAVEETPTLLMQHVMGLVSTTEAPKQGTGQVVEESDDDVSEEEEALEAARKEQRREAAALDASEPLTMPVFEPESTLAGIAAESVEAASNAPPVADEVGANSPALPVAGERSLPETPLAVDRVSALVGRPTSIQSFQSRESDSTLRAASQPGTPMIAEETTIDGSPTPRAFEFGARAVPPPPVPPRSPSAPEQEVEEAHVPDMQRGLPPVPPQAGPPPIPPRPADDVLAQLSLIPQRPVPPPPPQTDRQSRPYLRYDDDIVLEAEDSDSDSSGANTPIREDPDEDEDIANARRAAAIEARLASRNQDRMWASRPTRKLFGFGFGRRKLPFFGGGDEERAVPPGQEEEDDDDTSSEEEGEDEQEEEQTGQELESVAVKDVPAGKDDAGTPPAGSVAAAGGIPHPEAHTRLVAHDKLEPESVQNEVPRDPAVAEKTVDDSATMAPPTHEATSDLPSVESAPEQDAMFRPAEEVATVEEPTARSVEGAAPVHPFTAPPPPPTRAPPPPPPKAQTPEVPTADDGVIAPEATSRAAPVPVSIPEVPTADDGMIAPEATSRAAPVPVSEAEIQEKSFEEEDDSRLLDEEEEEESSDAEEPQSIVDEEDLARRDAAILSRLEARNRERGWMFRPSRLFNFGRLGRKRSAPDARQGVDRGQDEDDSSSSEDDDQLEEEEKEEQEGGLKHAEQDVEEADKSPIVEPPVARQDAVVTFAEPDHPDELRDRRPSEISEFAESEYSEAQAGTEESLNQDETLASDQSHRIIPQASKQEDEHEHERDHSVPESANHFDDDFVSHGRRLRASQVPQDAFLDDEHDDTTFVYSNSRVSAQHEDSEDDREDEEDHDLNAGGDTVNMENAFDELRLPGGYVPLDDFMDGGDHQEYHDDHPIAGDDRRPFSLIEGREGDQGSALSSSHDDAFSLEMEDAARATRASTLSLSPRMRSRPISGVERESLFDDDDGSGQIYLEVPSESDHAWTPGGTSVNTPFEFDEYSTPAGEMDGEDIFGDHADVHVHHDGEGGERMGGQDEQTPQLGNDYFPATTAGPAAPAPELHGAPVLQDNFYQNHSQQSSMSQGREHGLLMGAEEHGGDEPHWNQPLHQSQASVSSAGHFGSARSHGTPSDDVGGFTSFDSSSH